MHHRFRLAGLGLSIVLISSVTIAAQLYGTVPKQAQQFFPVPTVLSPQDFNSQAKTFSQQTKTNLSQQAAEVLPKKSSGTPNSTSSSSNSNTSSQATANTQPATPTPPAEAEAPAQTTMPFSSGSTKTTKSAPPASQETYTGFGTGSKSNTPAQNSNTNKSSGWKIY